ncbi:MAG: hypothetical protein IK115_12060 [Lachnospiraceae bacterium]|nr:hypothetical protein [Lachnospiraceae bacterium]
MAKRKLSKLGKKVLAVVLAAAVVCVSVPIISSAKYKVNSRSIVSNNIHDNDYTDRKRVANCYMTDNGNGTFARVENMGDIVLIENYNSSLTCLGQRFIAMELPEFGGFWGGAAYNYVLFGQNNTGCDEGVEVLRLVRYDKAWNRLNSTSVYGNNTAVPFIGCNTDFSEYGDTVYVRCGHMCYDGRQAVMTFASRNSDGALIQVQSGITGRDGGAYADSAATFIDVSDGAVTTLDHSLTDPHAIVSTRYNAQAGGAFISGCATADALLLPGYAGQTTPGTSIGGYEVSAQYRLVFGVTNPYDGSSPNRNIFIATVPKNADSTENVRIAYATGYAYGDLPDAMTPYVVKMNIDQFVVIWENRDGYAETETVNYVFVNGSGQLTSQVYSMRGCLSDCQPILSGGKIVWYTTNAAKCTVYSFPAVNTGVAPSKEAKAAIVNRGTDYSKVYDFAYYINRYPDMRVLYQNNPAGALQHFVSFGMSEGRQASENFDPIVYKNNYADLRNAFGDDWKQYYLHFISYGYDEGRNARN